MLTIFGEPGDALTCEAETREIEAVAFLRDLSRRLWDSDPSPTPGLDESVLVYPKYTSNSVSTNVYEDNHSSGLGIRCNG